MLPHTLTPETTPFVQPGAPAPQATTYGELVSGATRAFDHALASTTTGLPDPATARAELAGYERFFRVAGAHLRLLRGLSDVRSDALNRLSTYLVDLAPPETGTDVDNDIPGHARGDAPGGLWYEAASRLGAAHDLLASHFGDGLAPRTPYAQEQVTPQGAAAAIGHITVLVHDAATAHRDVTRAVLHAQEHEKRPHLTSGKQLTRLNRITTAIAVYAKAALWDQTHNPFPDPHTGPHAALADLEPAPVLTPAVTSDPALAVPPAEPRSTTFTNALAALAALAIVRQLSFDQAAGTTPLSPASLRDLTRLGARYTAPTTDAGTGVGDGLPEPSSPLQRVQRAHALDRLQAAHDAWTQAGAELTTRIQGTTKAPGAYASATCYLLHADPADPALRAAVLAALPRLAREAAAAATDLGHTGGLLTPHRDLSLRRTWAPISEDTLTALADRLRTAGRATAVARHATEQLTPRHSPPLSPPLSAPPNPDRNRQLQPTLEADPQRRPNTRDDERAVEPHR